MPSLSTLLCVVPALLQAVSAVPHINRRQTEETIPNKWIVRIEDYESLDSVLTTVLEEAGVEAIGNYSVGNVKGFNFEGDDAVLETLQQMGAIKSVEPDTRMYSSVPMGDISARALVSQSNAPWGLGRISRKTRGSTTYTYDSSAGAGTYIYVIDTGVNSGHTDFTGRVTLGASFISGSNGEDDQGHGTHCAGSAAGTRYGVAKKANIIAVKVLDSSGSGSNSGVLRGIDWAVQDAQDKGHISRTVISMSLGGSFSQVTNDAIAAATNAGAFVAVAAGNDKADASRYSPASAPSACTVGATTSADARASYSNYGSLVDIFAPGSNILSAWIGSSTASNTISGTSMATPHIAGLAAYLLGLEGGSTAGLCSRIRSLAQSGILTGVGSGSPNLLAYNGNGL
nr:hypothetical protein B0A51_16279 [Rachicladosporium sp. CCFEE 5018]